MSEKEINELGKNMFDQEKAQKYSETTDYVRGIVISIATRIEFQITQILVNHFCKANKIIKQDFQIYFMSDTLSFEQKKYPFSSLRKSKKITIKTDYKELMTDIDYIQVLRNLIAHSESYINPLIVNNYKGEQVQFLNFKSTKGERIIKVNVGEKVIENNSEFLYCINTFVERANRVVGVLKINTF